MSNLYHIIIQKKTQLCNFFVENMLWLHIFEGFRQFTNFLAWRDPCREHKVGEAQALTCLHTANSKHVSHVLIIIMRGVYAFKYLFACLRTMPSKLHTSACVLIHFSFALASLQAEVPYCYTWLWNVANLVRLVYGNRVTCRQACCDTSVNSVWRVCTLKTPARWHVTWFRLFRFIL